MGCVGGCGRRYQSLFQRCHLLQHKPRRYQYSFLPLVRYRCHRTLPDKSGMAVLGSNLLLEPNILGYCYSEEDGKEKYTFMVSNYWRVG